MRQEIFILIDCPDTFAYFERLSAVIRQAVDRMTSELGVDLHCAASILRQAASVIDYTLLTYQPHAPYPDTFSISIESVEAGLDTAKLASILKYALENLWSEGNMDLRLAAGSIMGAVDAIEKGLYANKVAFDQRIEAGWSGQLDSVEPPKQESTVAASEPKSDAVDKGKTEYYDNDDLVENFSKKSCRNLTNQLKRSRTLFDAGRLDGALTEFEKTLALVPIKIGELKKLFSENGITAYETHSDWEKVATDDELIQYQAGGHTDGLGCSGLPIAVIDDLWSLPFNECIGYAGELMDALCDSNNFEAANVLKDLLAKFSDSAVSFDGVLSSLTRKTAIIKTKREIGELINSTGQPWYIKDLANKFECKESWVRRFVLALAEEGVIGYGKYKQKMAALPANFVRGM